MSSSVAAASASIVGQRAMKRSNRGIDRCHRRLLEHDFAQPYAIRLGRRFARSPSATATGGSYPHNVGAAALRHWRSPYSLWHARRHVEAKAGKRGPAAELPPALGGRAGRRRLATRRSAASASSRARSSAAGRRSSASATPKSPRPNRSAFPLARKPAGVLTLLVDGAHAPLIQHLTPMIVDRVNRFFGYAAINRIVFRQGKPPRRAGEAAAAPAAGGPEGARRRAARNRRSRASRMPGVACGANCR